jgi:hypothetical protein
VLNPLSLNGADVPGFPVADALRTQNLMIANTHTFRPALVNYSRFALFRNRFDFDKRFNNTLPSSLGFQITPSFDAAVGPPLIQVSGRASVDNPITGPRHTLQNSARCRALSPPRARATVCGLGYAWCQVEPISGLFLGLCFDERKL